jgi:hypothetical protein
VHVPWSEVDAVTSVVTFRRSAADLRLGRGDVRWSKLVRRLPGS